MAAGFSPRTIKARLAAGLLLVALLAVSGCATGYDAPQAGADTATLIATAPVWVHAIDGKEIFNGLAGEKHFTISTGSHTIMVRYMEVQSHYYGVTGDPGPMLQPYSREEGPRQSGRYMSVQKISSESTLPVKFVAEAGHTYYVKDGMTGGAFWHPHISEDRDPVFQDVKAP